MHSTACGDGVACALLVASNLTFHHKFSVSGLTPSVGSLAGGTILNISGDGFAPLPPQVDATYATGRPDSEPLGILAL